MSFHIISASDKTNKTWNIVKYRVENLPGKNQRGDNEDINEFMEQTFWEQ